MAKATKRKATAKSAKKTSAKSAKKSAKTAPKTKRKGPKPGSKRITYAESLKKKVVAAVRKGMSHLEASDFYKVGKHSIPGWLKKH
jgi:hypothetical protein